MTINELSKYYYIQKSIDKLKARIKEIESISIGSSILTQNTTPNKNIKSKVESVAFQKIKLMDKLNDKLERLLKEESKLIDYIDSIDDQVIQLIVRMRFIELKKWQDIADELSYDRTTPYHKLKKYLKDHNE